MAVVSAVVHVKAELDVALVSAVERMCGGDIGVLGIEGKAVLRRGNKIDTGRLTRPAIIIPISRKCPGQIAVDRSVPGKSAIVAVLETIEDDVT